MKKTWILCTLCLLLLVCAGCAASDGADEPESLTIAVASDLHYLSPSLTDNGPLFEAVVKRGDGKLMLDIEAVTEAFTEQMIAEQPDLLILSGDLSFNGEKQSHLDLAEKLKRIEESGVQVLVLPGNHDMNVSSAACFEGEEYRYVDSVDAAEFREIYADFGYSEALSFDKLSGSYVYAPCRGLRIFMLDTNSVFDNTFPEESFDWLEKQLKSAKRAGAQILTVSHQNLLVHNDLFVFGYQIMNAGELEEMLVKYGARLHLSGHMHIQHAAEGGLTEVLTSPLSMTPCRYARLLWVHKTLSYEARSVDVSAWAAARGSVDGKLLRFDDYARDFFWQTAYDKTLARCLSAGMDQEDAERLSACFADTNLAYFSGEPIDKERLSSEIDFIEGQSISYSTVYLRSLLEDEPVDPLKIVFKTGKSP